MTSRLVDAKGGLNILTNAYIKGCVRPQMQWLYLLTPQHTINDVKGGPHGQFEPYNLQIESSGLWVKSGDFQIGKCQRNIDNTSL